MTVRRDLDKLLAMGFDAYQGTWDASTNSPSLASSVGTKGYYYRVSVAGSTDLNGTSNWVVGDQVQFDGTSWVRKSPALDSSGTIPLAQLPLSIQSSGGVSETYIGLWDASTNTPAITSGVGINGGFYKVSVAGSTTIDGTSTWTVGDQVIFNGSSWDRIPNLSAVSSVAGRTGAVTLSTSDITDFTTYLSSYQTTASKNVANGYLGLDATGKISVTYLPTLTGANVSISTSDVSGLSALLASKQGVAEKDTANGYAGLDANGKVLLSAIPQLSTSQITGLTSLANVATSGLYGDLTGTPTLAPVAISGSYADLTGLPDLSNINYTLPLATSTTAGGIKVGTGLSIDASGVLTANAVTQSVTSVNGNTGAVVIPAYSLPKASDTVLGGVKIGAGLNIDINGVVSSSGVTSLNGVTGAVTLDVTNLDGLALVAKTNQYSDLTGLPIIPSEYVLTAARVDTLGGIKVGSGLAIDVDGLLSVSSQYGAASADTLGLIKVGSGLAINSNGVLSVNVATGVSSVAGKSGAVTLAYTDISGLANVAHTGAYADLSGIPAQYSLPAATSTTLGGVKVGTGLNVSGDGTISVPAAAPIVFPVTSVAGKTGDVTLAVADIAGAQPSLGYTPVNAATANVANGYAALDSGAKIGLDQIPSALLGGTYLGTWNASTNTPELVSSTSTASAGAFYRVNTAGTTSLDGVSSWASGDTVIWNGAAWEKLNAYVPPVTSVFGRLGNVTLTGSDVNGALGYTAANDAAVVKTINGHSGDVTVNFQTFNDFAGMPHDMSWSIVGKPAAGESCLRVLVARPFTVPANFALSIASCYVAPSTAAVFNILKNNVSAGTITFAAGSTTGVFSTQAALSFARGDRLVVFAPVDQDATLADIDFTLVSALA